MHDKKKLLPANLDKKLLLLPADLESLCDIWVRTRGAAGVGNQ
jgi:hypothetical protein